MVESGKSFIKNVRREGRGWIYNNLEAEKQAVKQQRAEELANSETVDQLWDTDNTSVVWKVAEKIVNSNVWQKLVWLADYIGWGWAAEDIKSTVWTVAKDIVESKVWKWIITAWNMLIWDVSPETEEKLLQSKAWQTLLWTIYNTKDRYQEAAAQTEKEKEQMQDFLDKDVYEDTEKFERFWWVDEEWKQIMPSRARINYEEFISSWWTDEEYRAKFPDYRVTADWKTEYRTNGNYIVDKPVWHTVDLLDTLQDAYNSVTYAYAQNWTVYTPEDLKKAYPEYANVSDWELANFISWCMYDVQRWQRSDIQEIGNAMAWMSMAEWYTNIFDSYIDVLSDESILKRWTSTYMQRKDKYMDSINAAVILKDYVNDIKSVWAFTEWLSDWAILSNYRYMKSEDPKVQEAVNEINEYMTFIENQEQKWRMNEVVNDIYDQYQWAEEDVENKLESETYSLADTLEKFSSAEASRYLSDVIEFMHDVRDFSESESWYPMKNVFENMIPMTKFYRDNKGNYYKENVFGKQELTYSMQEDWTYKDAKTWDIYTKEQVDNMTLWFIWKMARWVASALADLPNRWAKIAEFASLLWPAYESGGWEATTQYQNAIAMELLWTYFDIRMSMPKTQVLFALPWIWDASSYLLELAMTWWWRLATSLFRTFWITDWWSTETQDALEEGSWIIFTALAARWIKEWGKYVYKKSPKTRAFIDTLANFNKKIFRAIYYRDAKVIEKMVKERTEQIEQEWKDRKNKIIKNQQSQKTTLAEDTRVKEKMDQKVDKETEQNKEKAKAAWEEMISKTELPIYKVAWEELQKAKDGFYNEFIKNYAKEVGWIDNMDPVFLAKQDLDKITDIELKKLLIDKYDDIYREQEINKDTIEMANFGLEIAELQKSIIESLTKEQNKEFMTTKELQERAERNVRLNGKLEKINKKYLRLKWLAKAAFKSNPYRYVLKEILKDLMIPEIRKKFLWKDKVTGWTRTSENEGSRVNVQERIIEHWKKAVSWIVKKLFEKREELWKIPEEKFWKDVYIDIKDLFTEFLRDTKVSNILSRLFKKWDLAIEEIDWKLEVVYYWKDTIKSPDVLEAINLLEYALDMAQDSMKDGKMLVNESSLYNFRKYFAKEWYNKKWDAKYWAYSRMAQDMYSIINDYIDTYKDETWVWHAIRAYDKEFQKFFDTFEIFEDMFNKNGEIKKESRNRIINIQKEFPWLINEIERLIPWTIDILNLVEQWHEIVKSIALFMEKDTYKSWIGKRVLRYGPMMLTAWLLQNWLPWWASIMFAMPVWETAWEWVQKTLWRKVPFEKEINKIMEQLNLTEEERQKVEKERPEGYKKTLQELDDLFDEHLDKLEEQTYERWKNEWKSVYNDRGQELRRWKKNNDSWESWWDANSPSWWNWGWWNWGWWNWGGEKWWWPKAWPLVEENIDLKLWELDSMTEEEVYNYMKEAEKDFKASMDSFISQAKDRKDAEFRTALVWWKMTSRILRLLEPTKTKVARNNAKKALENHDWKYLKSKISKTTWVERLIYTNALYKLMALWFAPSADLDVDFSEVKKNQKIKSSADYSTIWEKKSEFEANKNKPKSYATYWEDYANTIESLAKECKWNIEKLTDEMIDKSNISQFMPEEDRNTSKIYNEVREDVRKCVFSEKEAKSTSQEQQKRITVKEAEWKRIEEEVWELMDPEDIKKREDLWFSFDKEVKSKNKTRRDNQWATIVNKDKVDYIDWWLTRWTIMISWWAKDWMTRVMVNNLETLSNFPQVEKSLPKNSIIIDSSTWKEYSLADIQRMDIKGETNTKTFEEYYKKQMEEYPEEVQDIFNEKDQEVSSPEWKSEPQETQAEQSSIKEEKTTKSEQESEKKSKPKKISPEEEAHLFWEDKKTAEETNADSLVEAIKKYNWVDVAEFISHKWDKKGKTHIHLKDMTASDSRSFQEFVMNHKDLIEIYDDWWMGYVIKFKPWFKDNIKKYLK